MELFTHNINQILDTKKITIAEKGAEPNFLLTEKFAKNLTETYNKSPRKNLG